MRNLGLACKVAKSGRSCAAKGRHQIRGMSGTDLTRRAALGAAVSLPLFPAAACGAAPAVPQPARSPAPAAAPPAARSAQTDAPPPAPQPAARPAVITILGDSLTTGYGLPSSQALPAQLERELAALGVVARVRGAAVNGDTTAGGLRRVDTSVRPDTDLCVVALGGNDLLTFIEPSATLRNLDGIVRRLKARGIKVVLAGMEAPAELGPYARTFNAVYPAVARQHSVPLHPSLLAGVMLDRRYNQEDLVHPNALGVQMMARRLAPVVAAALRSGARTAA